MRVLHARFCGRLHGLRPQTPQREPRRGSSRPVRQFVPLLHLCRHDARRRGRRERRCLMAKVDWPAADKRALIGKRISRADGPVKATGAAKYSYDVNRPGLLYAKLVWSPYARAEVVSVDTGPAAALPGVKGVWKDDALIGKEGNFAGQILAAGAAQTAEI